MTKNHFYEKKGPFLLSDIIKAIGSNENFSSKKNIEIHGLESLKNASNKDITFFHSIKYKNHVNFTKAKHCITSDKLIKYLPERCNPIVVNNVLLCLSQITKLFYPNSITDNFCSNLKIIKKTVIKKKKT